MNWKLELLWLAGVGHFGILLASVQVPKVFDWKTALSGLPIMLRQLFWVYGVFIVMTIAALGLLTLVNLDALVAGDRAARSIAAFTAVFWGARLVVQAFVFDARRYLTSRWRWLGYHTLTGAFVYFTAVYTWAAIA